MAGRGRSTPAPPRAPTRPSQPPSARAAASEEPAALRWAAPLAIAVAALLAYANSLGNGFVWDDPIILTRQLVVFRTAADVLAPPRDIPQFSPDYYRPLTIATYLLDRRLGGGGPFAFHLSVVLAHTATSVLVYALALQLLGGPGRRAGAVAAGALFALHPIHTESVAWAAGRADVLATGFILAAVLLQGRTATWLSSAAAGVCAAAALGAKETGVALYPLLVLRDILAPGPRRDRTDWLRAYVGPVAAGAVYALLRRNALGEYVGSAPDALPAGERSALDLVGAVGVYVQKLLWPASLNAYIDRIDTGALTIVLAIALLVAAGAVAGHWLRTRRDGAALFAVAWLVLTLVPSLAIVWKIPDAPLAERYLYLPSVGACLLAGDLFARWWARAATAPARAVAAAVLALVLAAAAIATARRNPVWHDDIALWQDTEAKSQTSGMAARGLGTAYQQAGRADLARAAFSRALQRRNTPRGTQTLYNNLGTMAMYDRDFAAAEEHYRAALTANPNAPDTLFNLGLALLQRGGLTPDAARKALPYYQDAQRGNPHDPDVEAAMAQAYLILGDETAAAQHARAALDLGASGATAESLRKMLAGRQ